MMPPAVYKDVRVLSFRHVGEPQDLEKRSNAGRPRELHSFNALIDSPAHGFYSGSRGTIKNASAPAHESLSLQKDDLRQHHAPTSSANRCYIRNRKLASEHARGLERSRERQGGEGGVGKLHVSVLAAFGSGLNERLGAHERVSMRSVFFALWLQDSGSLSCGVGES